MSTEMRRADAYLAREDVNCCLWLAYIGTSHYVRAGNGFRYQTVRALPWTRFFRPIWRGAHCLRL